MFLRMSKVAQQSKVDKMMSCQVEFIVGVKERHQSFFVKLSDK